MQMSATPVTSHVRRSANAQIFGYYVLTALFVFGTALKPLLGDDNRNLLLIAFMGISPALAMMRHLRVQHVYLFLFLASVLLFPPLINPEHMRWSTVLFTAMFALSFVAYENALRASKMDIHLFIKAVRFILLAHFTVFVIQQIGVLTGLPILNESNYAEANRWKLNALSAEASHAARIVSVFMFAYLSLEEIRTGKRYSIKNQLRRDRFLWLGYIWMVATMQSATMFVLFPIILLKLTNSRNVIAIMVLGVVPVVLVALSQNETAARVFALLSAALTFEYTLLLEADHSGSLRIAPMFVLAEMVDLNSWQGLFGHGVDTVSGFMSNYIIGVPEGYSGGGMLRIWYEYGFITFALFTVFTMRVSLALNSVSDFLFWALLVFVVGTNNQMVWMYLIIFTSIGYFRRTHANWDQR